MDWELTTTPFFCYIRKREYLPMERDKLKLIVRNLRLLVDALESEVYSDVSAYNKVDETIPPLADYDEVFEDDGY